MYCHDFQRKVYLKMKTGDKIRNMKLDIKPASDYPMPDLLYLLNLSFEEYMVPITFNLIQFLTMLRKDSVDLYASRVVVGDGDPVGVALIARRGWTSRLAAMGIVKEARGIGAGTWLMEKVIQDAQDRKDRELVLEVIEQNEPAVKLYRKCGFETTRRLIGLIRKDAAAKTDARSLPEIDLRKAGALIAQHGLPDLPWQLAGETIAHLNPPARAFYDGSACVVTSSPDADHVVIWSVLVETSARGHGQGAEFLQTVMGAYPGRIWHVPAILPEELGVVFERAGFEREELSQFQMKLAYS
jgi:ribosomal protein S18 acetylase RimI-like enzyme